jgi:ribosomal protein S18 acetylase RimI-like enzyme
MSTNLQCSRVRSEDLKSVAQIHLRAFPESALTGLGLEAVRRYYEWQLTGPHGHEFIGIRRAGNLVGYAVGGVSRGATVGFVRRNAGFLACRMLTHPWLIGTSRFRGRLKLGLRSLSVKKPSPPPVRQSPTGRSFGILAIAVDPPAQGLGLGKLLINHLETVAIAGGFDRMHLTVEVANAGAIAFYERLGWSRSIKGEQWTGGMAKSLSGELGSGCKEALLIGRTADPQRDLSLLTSAATVRSIFKSRSKRLTGGSDYAMGGDL